MNAPCTEAAFHIEAVILFPFTQQTAAGVIHRAIATQAIVARRIVALAIFEECTIFHRGFFLHILVAQSQDSIPRIDVYMAARLLFHMASANLGIAAHTIVADVFFQGQSFGGCTDEVIACRQRRHGCSCAHHGVVRLFVARDAFYFVEDIAFGITGQNAGTFHGIAHSEFGVCRDLGCLLVSSHVALVQKGHGIVRIQALYARKGYLCGRYIAHGQVAVRTIRNRQCSLRRAPGYCNKVDVFKIRDVLRALAAAGPCRGRAIFQQHTDVKIVARGFFVAAVEAGVCYICRFVEVYAVVLRSARAGGIAAIDATGDGDTTQYIGGNGRALYRAAAQVNRVAICRICRIAADYTAGYCTAIKVHDIARSRLIGKAAENVFSDHAIIQFGSVIHRFYTATANDPQYGTVFKEYLVVFRFILALAAIDIIPDEGILDGHGIARS